MSDKQDIPPPCDREVFTKGEPIAALDARRWAAETWVQAVAKVSEQRVDWHYSGGIAQVLFLGDRAKVDAAIDMLAPTLNGTILERYGVGSAGLYRGGVTQLPANVIAVDTRSFVGRS